MKCFNFHFLLENSTKQKPQWKVYEKTKNTQLVKKIKENPIKLKDNREMNDNVMSENKQTKREKEKKNKKKRAKFEVGIRNCRMKKGKRGKEWTQSNDMNEKTILN